MKNDKLPVEDDKQQRCQFHDALQRWLIASAVASREHARHYARMRPLTAGVWPSGAKVGSDLLPGVQPDRGA
jgi:hypothetical protein